MSKVSYTGFIAGSLCKSVRYSRVPVVASRKDDRPVYAGEVARMRAGVRGG